MSGEKGRKVPVKARVGQISSSSFVVELTARPNSLEEDVPGELHQELEDSLPLPETVVVEGGLRPLGKGRFVVVSTILFRCKAQDEAARKLEARSTLDRVNGILERFFKRLRRAERRVNRELNKAAQRSFRAARHAAKQRLATHPYDHDCQVRPTNRTSLRRAAKARYGSRVTCA